MYFMDINLCLPVADKELLYSGYALKQNLCNPRRICNFCKRLIRLQRLHSKTK